jgi:hypothetical protein
MLWMVLLAGFSPLGTVAQKPRLPFRMVLVREELTVAGTTGHLELGGKEVAKTLETADDPTDPTTSRARVRYSARGDLVVELLDAKDDGGNNVLVHIGGSPAATQVQVGLSLGESPVRAELSSPDGKKLLQKVQEQQAIGKDPKYQKTPTSIEVTQASPVGSEEVIKALLRELYGSQDPGGKEASGILEIRTTQAYHDQAVAARNWVAEQLSQDEKNIRAAQPQAAPTTAPTPTTETGPAKPDTPSGGAAQPSKPLVAFPTPDSKKDKKKANKADTEPAPPPPPMVDPHLP